jgi:hypothetical protein
MAILRHRFMLGLFGAEREADAAGIGECLMADLSNRWQVSGDYRKQSRLQRRARIASLIFGVMSNRYRSPPGLACACLNRDPSSVASTRVGSLFK